MYQKFKDLPVGIQFKFQTKIYIKGKRSVRKGQPVNAALTKTSAGGAQFLVKEVFFLDSTKVLASADPDRWVDPTVKTSRAEDLNGPEVDWGDDDADIPIPTEKG